MLTDQIANLDERIANLYTEADPKAIIASAPGFGPVLAGLLAGRLGDPHRFTSLAAIRAYSGLVPKLNEPGQARNQHGLTKAGDPLLREAMFMAADNARKIDPHLAAKYARLMTGDRHHDSAICHLAAMLLTRVAACWRAGDHYVLRDLNGTVITAGQGRQIVRERHAIDPNARTCRGRPRAAQRQKGRTGREQKESPSAPASRPAKTKPTSKAQRT